MRKNIGEFSESVGKVYGSLRKRFGLQYDETLEYADRVFSKYNYPIIFISSDDSLSLDFIGEVNESGNGEAIGFYKDGAYVYDVSQLREMVPKLLNNPNKLVYISIEPKSRFRLEIPGSILLKMGKNADQLWIDIIVTEDVDGEVIRKIGSDDFKEFNVLLSELYTRRWEQRNDIFEKGFKFSSFEFSSFCGHGGVNGGFVCIRDEKIVGFILYQFSSEKEGRAYLSRMDLIVKDIFVLEEYRRLGIGTRLFNQVRKIANRSRCENIVFKVWSSDELTNKFLSSLHFKSLYSVYEIEV